MKLDRDPILAAAISLAIKDYASKIIFEFPELDRETVSVAIEKIVEFIRDNISRLEQSSFVIKLDFLAQAQQKSKLDISDVLKALNLGINVFVINAQLGIADYSKIDILSDASVSAYSREQNACVLYFFGREMRIFAKGYLKHHFNVLKPLIQEPKHISYRVDAHNYDLAIKEHFKKIRFGGIHSDHWQDRTKRILKAKPDKTEKHFQFNLWRWLDSQLDDADVLAEVHKITDDRTDIEIRVRRDGTLYIIEVKWLGINEHKTAYREDRIVEGINQVNNYIKREKFQSEVCLVAYDARKESDFEILEYTNCEPGQWKEIQSCQGVKLIDNARGFVFFLESKTASM